MVLFKCSLKRKGDEKKEQLPISSYIPNSLESTIEVTLTIISLLLIDFKPIGCSIEKTNILFGDKTILTGGDMASPSKLTDRTKCSV